jgi:isopentenyl phosphate kinase
MRLHVWRRWSSNYTHASCAASERRAMTEKNPFLVLKIGGSLFSDKRRNRHIEPSVVRKYARLLAELALMVPGRLALVLGGGSFGHGAMRDSIPNHRLGILGLTEANFALKWIWTQALIAEGVAALPFQLSSMCLLQGGELRVGDEVLRRSLAAGIVPVLSGDCIVREDGCLQLLGSDWVPQIFVACVDAPIRVVALTDTPLMAGHADNVQVLPYVDPDYPDDAYSALWDASPHDTTAAMSGKVHAFVGLARRGVECFIVKGDPETRSLRFLYEPPDTWPVEAQHTRISRRRTASSSHADAD